jgi:hypothetical protein
MWPARKDFDHTLINGSDALAKRAKHIEIVPLCVAMEISVALDSKLAQHIIEPIDVDEKSAQNFPVAQPILALGRREHRLQGAKAFLSDAELGVSWWHIHGGLNHLVVQKVMCSLPQGCRERRTGSKATTRVSGSASARGIVDEPS